MCLALPTCVLEVRPHQQALVELGGVKKEISTALVGEVKPGDYVIVHVGHAIGLSPSLTSLCLADNNLTNSGKDIGPVIAIAHHPPNFGANPSGSDRNMSLCFSLEKYHVTPCQSV